MSQVIAVSFFMLVLTTCPLCRDAKADWRFQSGNWSGSSYIDQQSGQFSHCAIGTSYMSGDFLMFFLNRDGQFGISIHNPNWQMRLGDQYPVSIEIDRYPPLAALANVVSQTQATASFPNAYELFQQVRRGRTMFIRTASGILNFDLTGTSRALQKAAECLYSELDRENARVAPSNPFAARAPQPEIVNSGGSEARLDRTGLVILASNVLAEAGLSGQRFLSDQERTGVFAGMDVAWVGPGNSAGGLIGIQLALGYDFDGLFGSLAPTLVSADASACLGRFASVPGTPHQEQGRLSLNIRTMCETTSGTLTIDYVFFGMNDGRLLRFTFFSMEGDERTHEDAEVSPTFRDVDYSGAAARVLGVPG